MSAKISYVNQFDLLTGFGTGNGYFYVSHATEQDAQKLHTQQLKDVFRYDRTGLVIIMQWAESGTGETAILELLGLLSMRMYDANGNKLSGTVTATLNINEYNDPANPAGGFNTTNESVSIWVPPNDQIEPHTIVELSRTFNAIYADFVFDFSAVPNFSYVDIGRLWLGPLWTLPDGIDAQWQQFVQDDGKVVRSRGQQGYSQSQQRYRVLDVAMGKIKEVDAFGDANNLAYPNLQDMYYQVGTTGDLIVLPRTNSSHMMHKAGVYGHIDKSTPIKHVAGPYYRSNFRLKELI